MPDKPDAVHVLRQAFDTFTQRCEASRLPAELQASALVVGYDPLLSQGTFRMVGDPHALAQTMIRVMRDPKQPRFREALEEVFNTLLTEG